MLYYYSICSALVCKAELKRKAFNYRNLKNEKKKITKKQTKVNKDSFII